MVFCQTRGGGSPRVVKKPYCFFEKVFLQRACRIILGPPKHVLHLVWSCFGIYLGIKITLKVALNSYLIPKNCGPSVRILTPGSIQVSLRITATWIKFWNKFSTSLPPCILSIWTVHFCKDVICFYEAFHGSQINIAHSLNQKLSMPGFWQRLLLQTPPLGKVPKIKKSVKSMVFYHGSVSSVGCGCHP